VKVLFSRHHFGSAIFPDYRGIVGILDCLRERRIYRRAVLHPTSKMGTRRLVLEDPALNHAHHYQRNLFSVGCSLVAHKHSTSNTDSANSRAETANSRFAKNYSVGNDTHGHSDATKTPLDHL